MYTEVHPTCDNYMLTHVILEKYCMGNVAWGGSNFTLFPGSRKIPIFNQRNYSNISNF